MAAVQFQIWVFDHHTVTKKVVSVFVPAFFTCTANGGLTYSWIEVGMSKFGGEWIEKKKVNMVHEYWIERR
jgi:hypothetical protein